MRMSNTGNKLIHIRIPLANAGNGSELAYLFTIDGRDVWVPKSQVKDYAVDGDFCSFWLPQWLVEAKELDYFVDTSHEPSLFEM